MNEHIFKTYSGHYISSYHSTQNTPRAYVGKPTCLIFRIVVSLNVNHSVDSAEPDDGSQEAPEMKSMPNFEVDIIKADKRTLSFSCSFVTPEEADGQEGAEDAFVVDEVTMFKGEEWDEKHYAVAGDILDGHLYDLFMDMLFERGITADFANQLSDYCSSYEHGLYVNLLQDLQKFVKS